MARLREGELLTRGILITWLIVAAFPLLPSGDGSALAFVDGDGPVFFEDPDPATARRIERGIELLRRTTFSDHTRGREILEEIGYWAVAPLIKRLKDGNSPEQRNSALVLGTIGDSRAFPHLLRSSGDDRHLYVPSFSALMLGKFGKEEALDKLEELIKLKKRDHRRIAAILSVAKIGGSRAFGIIERVARFEKRSLVRESAVFCLGFFRDQSLRPAERGVAGPSPTLQNALRSSVVGQRRAALLALALLGHRDLRRHYQKAALDDREDPEIQAIGLLALGRFPDEDVTKILLGVLSNPTGSIAPKTMAALLLKDRRDEKALAELKRANRSGVQDENLRAALVLALSNFEDEDVVSILTLKLQDRHDQVRSAAAVALSRLDRPEFKKVAMNRLARMLGGEFGSLDPDVHHNMKRAREILNTGESPGSFIWLGNRQFAEDLAKDVEEMVLDLMNREAQHVLELSNLTQIKAGRQKDPRFRVDDEGSDLRDLKAYLDRHPYFQPADIPEPRLAITPREEGK